MSKAPPHPPAPPVSELSGHVIIAGFGIVGRLAADVMHARGTPYCIVEMNEETVARCQLGGVPIFSGDVRREEVLERAGIHRAALLAIAVPDEPAVLAIVETARRMNPHIPIVARLSFTSAGLQAMQLGATVSVVAEQVVAQEFARVVREQMKK